MTLAKVASLILGLAPSVAIITVAIWNPFKSRTLTILAYLLYFSWAIPTLWSLAHT